MKGYKAFDKDLKCRDFQYEIGKTYKHEGKLEVCHSGFHFCKSIADCYSFYPMDDDTRICEIEAVGEVKTDDGIKYTTSEITVIAEIIDDRLKKCNIGLNNSANYNSANYNSGNSNSGNSNSGSFNCGNRNSANYNSANYNSGNSNSGNSNSGSFNCGNRNSGDYNSGDWNATNFSSGCFCTEEPEMLLFDKPSGMTLRMFTQTKAYLILSNMPTAYKSAEWNNVTNTLDNIDNKGDRQVWYDNLADNSKDTIKSMPNFDAGKFEKCTGIKV